jgi:hypothetical protein
MPVFGLNHGLRVGGCIERRHSQSVGGAVGGMPVALMRKNQGGGSAGRQLMGQFFGGDHASGERRKQTQPKPEVSAGDAEFPLAFRTPFGPTAQGGGQHPDLEGAFLAQSQREQTRDGFVIWMRCQY